ncbi:MAG: CHRD domain-containing protein [Gemmatimonadetes bacterium]|uniref:CHRD domain-containing protein n=1 Tax=Candidatus Kutchimonas denitrificans TaxID=3056748 RepID=A0AAE5C9M6_9BACT|nr:CHRD domain-containing protein [Gemmatimonadota bacterium]NIR73577.1 CHRD domain-containing protein [Candidatus Kutchimonas denitrificans]NIR99536.1 CHRD domain-containing protein [Gemmatimonadota bacterium]NIT65156.1 CHRD domain-containing protein [Gemmatimonadota bacterium]NIV23689.1 CHRD domain-containing protein [Gemmatimonadota bacterium]
MRSRVSTVAVLALPLFLALACGEQAEQAEEGEGEGMEAAAGSMAETPTMSLSTMNNSGVMASANLSHTDQSLSVTLELEGLEPGATYPAHIHRGNCEDQGPVAAPLGEVTAAEDGTGTIEASVPMSDLSAPAEGEMAPKGFYVQVHLPDGTPAACGEIRGPAGMKM